MRNNPFAGAPAHVDVLARKLMRDERPGVYSKPPSTGGKQLSIRLGDDLITHLEVIADESKWNRAEVLTALIERGLFDLYGLINDKAGDNIMEKIAHKLVPAMFDESHLLEEAKRLLREIATDDCTFLSDPRPESFWMEGERVPKKGIPRLLVRIDSQAAEDFANARRIERAARTKTLRSILAKSWATALDNPGADTKLLITPELFGN
jgi:hypothetical protein